MSPELLVLMQSLVNELTRMRIELELIRRELPLARARPALNRVETVALDQRFGGRP